MVFLIVSSWRLRTAHHPISKWFANPISVLLQAQSRPVTPRSSLPSVWPLDSSASFLSPDETPRHHKRPWMHLPPLRYLLRPAIRWAGALVSV